MICDLCHLHQAHVGGICLSLRCMTLKVQSIQATPKEKVNNIIFCYIQP